MAEEEKTPRPGEAALKNMQLLKNNSPATFDTPEHNLPFSPLPPTVRGQKSDNPADAFLANHTSEDNASYDRVIALEDRKRASKLASQFEAEVRSIQLVEAALALPSIEQQADQTERPYEAEVRSIQLVEAALALPSIEQQADQTERPVIALEGYKLASQFEVEVRSIQLVEAALALPSIEQQADQTERPYELDTWRYTARNHIMYVPDRAASQRPPPKPELMHHNTRLKNEPFDHDATATGKIGVDGTSATTDKGTAEYGLVGTPSPRPGAGPDASPLMTWGEIEGTPFRLDGGDTPLPAMSPAARKLAAKHLLSPRLKLTPNDVGVHHASPKRTPRSRRRGTPSAHKEASASASGTIDNNITDNLLQINLAKRTRVAAAERFH
ncbi:Protein DGCR14-like protein [Operophtera brumata]|uniref:Protein DGCR14-like protein n=1 Tax=Operophtera brumata TaxID=104452 RepID=A0A0L7LQ57_OPEBR|nr:Protein DGCR14-like protein [Operophtera brumata]